MNNPSGMYAYRIEYEIARVLGHNGGCTLDELIDALPECSWNQVFTRVDAMSRDGRVRLEHPDRFGIRISLRTQAFQAIRHAV